MKKQSLLFILLILPFIASAQSSSDNGPLSDIMYIAVIIASIFITRAVFGIPRILRSLRSQTFLLGLIAEKQGCDAAKIKKALDHVDADALGDTYFTVGKFPDEVRQPRTPQPPPAPRDETLPFQSWEDK